MEIKAIKGKEIKIPGPDHPITISPVEGKVRVTVAGRIVAESTRALRLEEKGYPPVYYLPRDDADMSLLVRTKHTPIVRTRAIALITTFLSAEQNRNMPFGLTKRRMRQSPALENAWRFIPHGSMQSKSRPKQITQRICLSWTNRVRERNEDAEDYTRTK
jgi:hypothetical protein